MGILIVCKLISKLIAVHIAENIYRSTFQWFGVEWEFILQTHAKAVPFPISKRYICNWRKWWPYWWMLYKIPVDYHLAPYPILCYKLESVKESYLRMSSAFRLKTLWPGCWISNKCLHINRYDGLLWWTCRLSSGPLSWCECVVYTLSSALCCRYKVSLLVRMPVPRDLAYSF